MDEELRSYLQGMEDRTAARIVAEVQKSEERMTVRIAAEVQKSEERMTARIAAEVQKSEDRTAVLIAAEVGGLHTQIKDTEDRLSQRLESISARLTLQAGLIQSGARAMARFSSFAENSEERWVGLLDRFDLLDQRVKRLEGNQSSSR